MQISLSEKKHLNLAAVKLLVSTAEAEARERNVEVTICVMDDSANLLFLQKGDGASFITVQYAQRKARYAALYGKHRRPLRTSWPGAGCRYWWLPMLFRIRAGFRSRWMAGRSGRSQ